MQLRSTTARQVCALSGASIPKSRTLVAPISMVSPSITWAAPLISPATAGDTAIKMAKIQDRLENIMGFLGLREAADCHAAQQCGIGRSDERGGWSVAAAVSKKRWRGASALQPSPSQMTHVR